MNEKPSVLSRSIAAAAILVTTALHTGCVDWSGDVARYRKVLDGPHPEPPPAYDCAENLSLTRALALADADNESIASRGEQWISALAQKMRAAGTFLPTLAISPSDSITHSNGTAVITPNANGGVAETIIGAGTSNSSSVPLGASLTGSLVNVSNFAAAGRTAEELQQLLYDQREAILLEVVQSYYAVLRSERQADVYVHSLQLKSEKVRDQEVRLKLGNVRPLDLAQSQADLAGTSVSLTQSRTDAANARSALARLIGVASVDGPLTDKFATPDQLDAIANWQRRAESHRQDYLATQRAADAARYSLQAAIREYFPSVSINFAYFIYNQPTSSVDWAGGISANVPIFSALAIEADIRAAWSAYRQSVLNVSQTRRQVTDDIRQGYQNLSGSREKISQLQIQVQAAQRAFDLAERAYQLGAESNLDRLTQQDNLLTAQLNLVSEQFNEKTSYLSLLRAEGMLASVLQEDHASHSGTKL
jgi:outer membrane protein TolC